MKMQNTEMEFVSFDTRDVIATSTPAADPYVSFANFGNGYPTDNAITISGTPYTFTTGDDFAAALNATFNTNKIKWSTVFYCDGMTGTDVNIMEIEFQMEGGYDEEYMAGLSSDSGIWKWINNQFVKQ